MSKKFVWAIASLIVLSAALVVSLIVLPSMQYRVLQSSVGPMWSQLRGSDMIQDRYNLAYRYFADPEYRDLEKAETLLNANLVSKKHEPSHYLLVRVYAGLENREDDIDLVIDTANAYLENYPDKKRMYYNLALASAYRAQKYEGEERLERMQSAANLFSDFIEFAPTEWAGYLDSSWLYFQMGDLDKARDMIERGYAVAPENAWITSAYGVILMNQQETEPARMMLQKSVVLAEKLEAKDWVASYSSSNPKYAQQELEKFREVLRFNLQLLEDKDALDLQTVRSVFRADFADASPLGLEYGLHVSACRSSCPACNVCGQCNIHTPHGTGDGPNCTPPPLPAHYNTYCLSAPNPCGFVSEGTKGCDGSCRAAIPAKQLPAAAGFYVVPKGGQLYVYEADTHRTSSLAQSCYLVSNQTSKSLFVPVRSVAEFESFVQSTKVQSSPDVSARPVVPGSASDQVIIPSTGGSTAIQDAATAVTPSLNSSVSDTPWVEIDNEPDEVIQEGGLRHN